MKGCIVSRTGGSEENGRPYIWGREKNGNKVPLPSCVFGASHIERSTAGAYATTSVRQQWIHLAGQGRGLHRGEAGPGAQVVVLAGERSHVGGGPRHWSRVTRPWGWYHALRDPRVVATGRSSLICSSLQRVGQLAFHTLRTPQQAKGKG